MPRTPSESEIQRAFTLWFKGEPGKIAPAGKPGVIAWHTPNGGARSAIEGKRFKESGVEPGIHDYLFLWGGLYGLEFKKPGGRLSEAQKQMHPRMIAAGMVASATVDNLDDAKETVRQWGLTRF